jgi:hypothetical protein
LIDAAPNHSARAASLTQDLANFNEIAASPSLRRVFRGGNDSARANPCGFAYRFAPAARRVILRAQKQNEQ